ncbi:M1 family metallopeptidase [Candidatus Saccharibacteria bacterium]|nr:M1 family metallopeptidase [Candidatus Saccharibacteria bacterium]
MEHLIDFFIPKSYKIHLFLDKHSETISGTEEIVGEITSAGLLKLHSVGQEIDFLRINGEKTDYKLENCVLSALAAPGSDVRVEVGFHGSLNKNMQGAYLSSYSYEGREERIISTQFESHYARETFPCVDEPAAKATFSLSITVPDEDDIVLSNMPGSMKQEQASVCFEGLKTWPKRPADEQQAIACCHSRGAEPQNKQTPAHDPSLFTWTFDPTPKMSTYLLAFVVGKFNVLEKKTKSGITVRTYAPLDKSLASLEFPTSVAVKSLDYYENLFSLPYPLKKLDQVAIPDFEAGAMENWGLVTYRESQLLCTNDSSQGVKESVALTVTHELSHQWFGNLVTMTWWNDLWLNESFATIMEYYCTDHIFPEYKVWNGFFTYDCVAALRRDGNQGVQSVREDVSDPAEIATLFDPCIVYAKGAHLVLMLIREMGEENFFKGLKSYFEKNKYKNAEADDLWTALNPFADFDVKKFMHGWISQPGYPVLTDEVQQRFLFDGTTDDTKYPLPEIRDDMSGHYLINLSASEFDEALKNFSSLSEEQRLRLLIDRIFLSDTPLVSSASLLPLLDKFKNETSAPVWDLLSMITSKLSIFIDFDSPEEKKYKSYLYNLVEKPLSRLGLSPKLGEPVNDTDLRNTLLANALYSKNEAFLKSLASLYKDNLEEINSEIRGFVLSAKMWLEEKSFYPEVLDLYKKSSDPEIKAVLRSALSKPREKKNIDLAFSFLGDKTIIKPQDHLSFYLGLRRWRFTRERSIDWLFENWNYVKKINGEKSIEDYPRYLSSTIDERKDADKFFEFFTPMSDDPVLARTLKVAKNTIESTLSLIESDKKSVLKAINKL